MELAARFEVQPSNLRNDGKPRHREHFPADTPCEYWKRAMKLPFMDYYAALNEHMTVSGSRSLRGSVHHTERTGAPDTRKTNPAVGSVPSLEICVNYKTKWVAGRQDGT